MEILLTKKRFCTKTRIKVWARLNYARRIWNFWNFIYKKKVLALKHELKCEQDLIIQEESETSEIFSGLYDKRKNVIYELYLKEIKLEKLGVSITKIDKAKNQII